MNFLGFAPVSAPVPTSTPQLAREYIYAGNRLLAVEDAGAQTAAPTDLAVWRISSGTWYVMGPGGSVQAAQQWGLSTVGSGGKHGGTPTVREGAASQTSAPSLTVGVPPYEIGV